MRAAAETRAARRVGMEGRVRVVRSATHCAARRLYPGGGFVKLKNKVALVTGAGRGIGRGIAEIFAEEGADVAINYIEDPQQAEDVAAWVRCKGRRAMTVYGDVAN